MFTMKSLIACALAASMALVRDAHGATIRVPADQPTIQAGIDAASPGDSVVVACGTYYEYNIVMRPSIVLKSETGNDDCVVVDAKQRGRVVICPEGISLDTRIEGLTLTGGLWMVGAGLHCVRASPTVVNCALIDNQVLTVTAGAGGAELFESSASFTNCVFAYNIGPAIVGARCPSVEVNGCTFYQNRSHSQEGTIVLFASAMVLQNCLIAFSSLGAAVHCVPLEPSTVELQCCNVYGNANGDWVGCIESQEHQNGNLALDPLFCDAEGRDWHLCSDSPCAPEQAGTCGLIGALPVGCGSCGPQALEPSTWGQIKHHAVHGR